MTTLAEMRAKVRNFIRDTNLDETRRKVTDDELDDYLGYALSDYSLHFPRQSLLEVDPPTATVSAPLDSVPGENSVDLVQVGADIWTPWKVQEGESLPTSGKYWYWRGGEIAFASTPADAISVWYRGTYPFPAGVDDSFTIPTADEELLVLYAAAKFHQKMGTVAAKLDRFKERGERDDSPLVLMHDLLMREYNAKVSDRLHRGTVRVRRIP